MEQVPHFNHQSSLCDANVGPVIIKKLDASLYTRFINNDNVNCVKLSTALNIVQEEAQRKNEKAVEDDKKMYVAAEEKKKGDKLAAKDEKTKNKTAAEEKNKSEKLEAEDEKKKSEKEAVEERKKNEKSTAEERTKNEGAAERKKNEKAVQDEKTKNVAAEEKMKKKEANDERKKKKKAQEEEKKKKKKEDDEKKSEEATAEIMGSLFWRFGYVYQPILVLENKKKKTKEYFDYYEIFEKVKKIIPDKKILKVSIWHTHSAFKEIKKNKRIIRDPFRHNIVTIELANEMTILLEKVGGAVLLQYLDADEYECCMNTKKMVEEKRADGKGSSNDILFHLTHRDDLVKENYNQTKNNCQTFANTVFSLTTVTEK